VQDAAGRGAEIMGIGAEGSLVLRPDGVGLSAAA